MKLKQFIPHISAIVIFLILSIVYVSPILDGKKIKQGDIVQFKGMSKEIADFRAETGEEPLWTNGMFSGMPAYQVSMVSNNNLMKYVDDALSLWLPRPADYIFLNFLGFFILLIVLGVNPWLSILGAIGYAFSSYFFIIIEAGHTSKAHAMTYMAPVVAGVILAYRKKYLVGGAITALFLALEIYCNHLQITYYLAFIVAAIGIAQLVTHIKDKELPSFFKASIVLIVAALLAVGTNSTMMMTTMEYAKHSIRGASELTTEEGNKTTGLDKDYATSWSYGQQETFNLFIPNVKGGASGYIGNDNKSLKDIQPEFRQNIAQSNHYWGDQPGTSGPVYLGAILFFLFILGIFIVNNSLKWALLGVSILAIMLAWGHNMMWFTEFFLDYFPGYNKFRTVSMILVIVEFTVPLLAILTLQKLIKEPEIIKEKKNAFFAAFGLTGGLALIFYIMPDLFFDFLNKQEVLYFDQQIAQAQSPAYASQLDSFVGYLETVRMGIFKADAIRSFFFIAIAAALIYVYHLKKIKVNVLILSIAVLILFDMWSVDKRYLNDENFVRKSKVNNPFPMTSADKQILADNDPNFRVFNLSVDPFNDASTSFYHKSLGGYHGAKMRRYQELIEYHISRNNEKVLDMLNTKYFIIPNDARTGVNAQLNRNALGNAWFVKDIKMVENADAEILALNNFNPAATAIIDKRFEESISDFVYQEDLGASIKLLSYQPNHLVYESITTKDQLAVFSEIYYAKGWNATIDGEPMDHFRANYVLRSMIIPTGKHTIEFKFEPKSYSIGEGITLVSSILILLLLVGVIYVEIKNNKKTDTVA